MEASRSLENLGVAAANSNSTNGSVRDESFKLMTADEGPLITFFIPDLSVGGAERVTVNIVNGLARRGFNIELLVSRNRGPLRAELDDSIPVRELWPYRTSLLGVAAHIPALTTYFRKKRPAIFIPQLEHPSIVSLVAAGISQTDCIVVPTQHSSFGPTIDETLKDGIVHTLVPHLYPRADGVIAVSSGVATSLVNNMALGPKDITVLHNPVEVEDIMPLSKEEAPHQWLADPDIEAIVFVGRLAAQKDLLTWIDVFHELHSKRPRTRGIIVGTGPKQGELQDYAREMGLEESISFPGFVKNQYAYMGHADAFLLTSHYEGLPTVLIEAMASGCPVVSTDCPSGPREILRDGELGPLAPIGDVQHLVQSLELVLSEPPSAEFLIERAMDFSPETVFERYERFLNSLTETNRPSNRSVSVNEIPVNR